MQFNTFPFMVFFAVVVAVLFVIPRRLRKFWLLAVSYYYYMSFDARYAILIGSTTVVTYVSARIIANLRREGKESAKQGKRLLLLSILLNLGILAFFKYGNFAVDSLNSLFGIFHVSAAIPRVRLILTIGISFYTFSALAYVIDVYRGKIEVETDFFSYALFVAFFPKLVAGPIERPNNLLPQFKNIEDIKLWDARRVASGLILMVYGLFVKMVIADRVAILVDTVFDNYRMYGSTELIVAALGFTLQIYCDFGSYSMIAMGISKVMGFELMENFVAPYFATSVQDFWRRWHISLSTWFRDYLYIPLGGNRRGKLRKYLNLMIVFLVSGLWHGSSWTFVIWGGINGLYQVIGGVLMPSRKALRSRLNVKTDCFSWRLLQTLGTILLISFAWIFFRANTIGDAFGIITRIFTRPTPWLLFNDGLYELGLSRPEVNILLFATLILFLTDLVREHKQMTLDVYLLSQNIWFEWAVIILLILMLFIYGEYGPAFDAKQFIYFQF